MKEKQSCAVIGAGIVGICCGIALLEKGYNVTLYDSESPGSLTSKGNAGGYGYTDVMPMASPGILKRVPKWLLDPCGPLFVPITYMPKLLPWLWGFHKASSLQEVERSSRALSSLLEISKVDTANLIHKADLRSLYTELGAITVYKNQQSALKDKLEWDVKKSLGVEVQTLKSAEEIHAMEPEIKNVGFGYYTPQWCNTIDPFVMAQSLCAYFEKNGGTVVPGKISSLEKRADKVTALVDSGGQSIKVDHVVIAAGVWSKYFCKQLGDRVLLESERGYNSTLPNPGVALKHQVIFGEEKFVITNIGKGLRIGGAAEFAGLDRQPNYKRSEKLVDIARQYLPQLDDSNCEKWMGHRPSTPDSLPVIGSSQRFSNAYYAFGHGHYGLTMAASTGKLIAELVNHQPSEIDLTPFSISRFN